MNHHSLHQCGVRRQYMTISNILQKDVDFKKMYHTNDLMQTQFGPRKQEKLKKKCSNPSNLLHMPPPPLFFFPLPFPFFQVMESKNKKGQQKNQKDHRVKKNCLKATKIHQLPITKINH